LPARRRLFVAVWPPPELLETLEGLERPEVKGLRWTTQEQWHVTLRFLGSVAEEDVEPVVAMLDGVAVAPGSELARPVVAVAGPKPKTLGRAVWMLPVTGLEGLAGVVDRVLDSGSGPWAQERDAGRFNGHLTLARARRPSAVRGLPVPAISSTWTVHEVTLVNSTLHPHGARYEVIERWRL
jgi:2'-5' RNA ligase